MKKLMILSVLTFTTNSYAQVPKSWNFSIGPGLFIKNNLREDNRYSRHKSDSITYVIPFIQGRYQRLSLGPQGLSYRVVGDFNKNVSLSLSNFGDRYKNENTNTRYSSLSGSIGFKYLNYNLEIKHDIQDRSDGTSIKLSYMKMNYLLPNLLLMTNLGVELFDCRYADYYYSNNSNDPANSYKAKNFVVPVIGLLPIIRVSKHFSFTAGTFIKYYPTQITNSPLMNGDQFEFTGVFGFSYNL